MSTRVDTASLILGSIVIGVPGHGVLAELIPSSGERGAAYAYNDLELPGDRGKEIRTLITTWPALGKLYAYEDTSFVFDGPDGTHTFQYQLYVNGLAVGAPVTTTISIGV